MMGDILNLLLAEFEGLSKECVEVDSFVTGIKLLSYRLVMAYPIKEKGDEKLLRFIKENYPKEWSMAVKVSDFVAMEYKRRFTEEEKLYFAIQLKRINDLFS